jgi:uncharacterized protein YkwD
VYGVETPAAPTGLEARTLEAALSALARQGGRPAASTALSLAARELAGRAADGDPDPLAVPALRTALSRAAAFDPAPRTVLVKAGPSELADAVASRVPRARATHAGVGVARRGPTAWAVLIASERTVALDPFPRDVRPGAEAALSGTLGPGLRWPRVFVTQPGETVDEVGVSGERAFRARITFPRPGRYVVEVVGDAGGNPEVLALLTVSSGGAGLAVPEAPSASLATGDGDADAAAGVLRAVNLARGRQGLAPVKLTAALSELARIHSEVMLAARRVAHVLAGSGELGDRLRRARVPFARAYENVGRARTVAEAHRGAEESPAHLANILRPGARELGVGFARGRLDATGDASVYLTEIFVEPPDAGAESPLMPDARVREVLWRERSRTPAPPLTADPRLDEIARQAAAAMLASDDTEPGDLSSRALALERATAAVDVFVASGPEEAARSANVRNARFRRVGVGVALGDSARFGAGRLWIAVVYTD